MNHTTDTTQIDPNERRAQAMNVTLHLLQHPRFSSEKNRLSQALSVYLRSNCRDRFVDYLVHQAIVSRDDLSSFQVETITHQINDTQAVFETMEHLVHRREQSGPAELSPSPAGTVDAEFPSDFLSRHQSLVVKGPSSVIHNKNAPFQLPPPPVPFDTITDTHRRAYKNTDKKPPPPGTNRYVGSKLLGAGGMGEVFAVDDLDLQRQVALKRVRPDRANPENHRRFLVEAQVTAQLEHPSIVPVHDIGRLDSGDPFFTMKCVDGITLRDILNRLRTDADGHFSERFSPMRMGIIYLHVLEAVSYAHDRGVVHCDLKPDNILIGQHGEVQVMDWGLAYLQGQSPDSSKLPPVTLSLGLERTLPRGGTLQYCAPEQLMGDDIDLRADVYSLGALLYEMLCLHTTFEAQQPTKHLVDVFTKPLVPPSERAPQREISPDLEGLCLRALSPSPDDRFESVEELREQIEGFLTGARRRANAESLFVAGDAAHRRWQALGSRKQQLQVNLQTLNDTIKSYDDEETKAPLWALEEESAKIEVQAEEALAETLDLLAQAAGLDEHFLPPQERLADLHLELFLTNEERGDRAAVVHHRRQVERYHHGRHARILSGDGLCTLSPTPKDARVRLIQLAEAGKKFVDAQVLHDAQGGFVEEELPMGSYRCQLQAPGYTSTTVPLLVGRGASVSVSPALLKDDTVPDGFVHIPAGPFIYGGDKDSLNAGPREELELPAFLMARYPVTCGQYLDFLNAIAPADPVTARKHVPRTKSEGGHLWEFDCDGEYALPTHDADGNPIDADAPVMGVSFHDAEAYATWKSKVDGESYRLASEEEWEKAARGADGRIFPWGNGFDPTFCKMALSRKGRPQPEKVGAFPTDTSVYGMKDCAGSIREWTGSYFDAAQETRVLRGGAWYFNPAYCRLPFRHGYMPHIVFTNFGIRLAMDIQDET